MGGWTTALSELGGTVKRATKAPGSEGKSDDKGGSFGSKLLAAGAGLAKRGRKGQESGSSSPSGEPAPSSYKRGGKVRKTGLARLHKGERVLTKRQAKRYRGK